MTKFDNPLSNLKVASPCSQDWDAMIGDNRKRYCGECKLNVFNLSGMSKTEAENLITNAEGRLCVRFYKRADGSVITENCPVGWAKVKQRTKVYVTAFASLIFSFFSAIGLVTALNKANENVMGDIATSSTPRRKPTPNNENMRTMGAMVMPTPKRTPTPQVTVGRIAAPKQDQQIEMGEIPVRDN